MGNGNEDDSSVAQWARDPSGRHVFRYWDGTRWTGHVSDKRVMPMDPPKDLAEHPGTPPPGPPRTGESGPPTPVPTPPTPATTPTPATPATPPPSAAPAASATTTGHPTRLDGELEAAHHETRLRSHRRQAARRRRAFFLGLLAGLAAAAVAAAAVYAALDVKITTGSSSQASHHHSTASTTTTTSPATTTTVNPGRPPGQVRLRIINASAVPNAASMKGFALGGLGYPVSGLADGPVQQGTVVQCKPGFEAEAVTLAKAVGPGTTVQPFPSPAPAGSANADCLVILGK